MGNSLVCGKRGCKKQGDFQTNTPSRQRTKGTPLDTTFQLFSCFVPTVSFDASAFVRECFAHKKNVRLSGYGVKSYLFLSRHLLQCVWGYPGCLSTFLYYCNPTLLDVWGNENFVVLKIMLPSYPPLM